MGSYWRQRVKRYVLPDDVKGADFWVLLTMADLVADGEYECFASAATIAEEARIGRDTVFKAWKRLERVGEIIRVFPGRGRSECSHWVLRAGYQDGDYYAAFGWTLSALVARLRARSREEVKRARESILFRSAKTSAKTSESTRKSVWISRRELNEPDQNNYPQTPKLTKAERCRWEALPLEERKQVSEDMMAQARIEDPENVGRRYHQLHCEFVKRILK